MSVVAAAPQISPDQSQQHGPDAATNDGLQQLTSAFAAAAEQAPATSNGSGGGAQHPNIFVRGLPLSWSEAEITAVFQQYGQLTSIRLVRHSVTKQSLG